MLDRALISGSARALDGGKGRIREAVETAAMISAAAALGALHVAAANGSTRVCAYLVEELEMDVNSTAVGSGVTLLDLASGLYKCCLAISDLCSL